MQKVVFTNSLGESVELFEKPFFLHKIEGLGNVEADISSSKSPGQDGSTPTEITMAERYIPIEVVVLENLQHNRRLLSRVFNPKLGAGTLVYENDTVRREIKAISEHVPKFYDNRPRKFELVNIDLVCHDPYWMSSTKSQELVVWEGGLQFPLELPTEFAKRGTTHAKILLNEGDTKTPILVTFNGPVTAPVSIINETTGEFITVNQSLLEGEKLEINTAFGNKRVTKIHTNGSTSNVFHYINIDSVFFSLVPGNNLINYSTGGDYETAGVEIKWNDKYLGM